MQTVSNLSGPKCGVRKKFWERLEPTVTLRLGEHSVKIQAWCYWITGITGHKLPVYFLDTDVPDNPEWERTLTNNLYGGDERYRLCQETVLGIGGVRSLRALGHHQISRFHTNEGHAALLTVALLEGEVASNSHKYFHESPPVPTGSIASPAPSFQFVSAAGGMKLIARSVRAVMVRLGLTPRFAATTDPSQTYIFL